MSNPVITVLKNLYLLVILLIFSGHAFSQDEALKSTTSELTIGDRSVSIWSWYAQSAPRGVILFSHGAASAPWKYESLIADWVKAGFNVHAPLHVDSIDHPQREAYQGMASWKTRLEDMHMLADVYGNSGYIAAGHSYGALLALTLGGVEATIPEGYTAAMDDERVKLVLAFSPPPALPGLIDKDGFSGLSVPALIQTGTQDNPFGAKEGWQGHLDAYEMAPEGGYRFALVLEGVDHYFGGAICRPELSGPKQLTQLKTAADISLLLIEAFFEKDQEAPALLQARLQEKGAAVLTRK